MSHLGIPISKYVSSLENNFVLRTICGLKKSQIPKVASFYDFMSRIIKIEDKPIVKLFKKKPKKKLAKGEKLPPKNPGVVARLANAAKEGRRLNNRPELILQELLAIIVEESSNLGIIDNNISASGDGTCMATGASHYGKYICDCRSKGLYKCDCKRKYSDRNASWGWDSYNVCWYYGYTGYFLSTYNKELKIDLPLYIRIVDAARHDGVSAIVALTEFRDLHPNLNIDCFISDSASDNLATYDLLKHWDINAVIALNKKNSGKSKFKGEITIDSSNKPICPAGHHMVYDSTFKEDHRTRDKWRCPRVKGIAERSKACDDCSQSLYGRTFYINHVENDIRLNTNIPRHSAEFKNKMKERTAAERINNTLLNTYGIKNAKTRGKKRISFFTTMAAINVHLRAQVKLMTENGLLDINNILGNAICA
jgi:hypothetical protein